MSVPASLAEEKDKSGIYVAAEVGQATIKNYCTDTAIVAAAAGGSLTCSDKEIVFGADVGYRFNKYFAAELGGRISSGYDVNILIPATGVVPAIATKLETDYTSALLGVRGSYPFNDKFSVHVNTGFHVWETELTGTFNGAPIPKEKQDGTDPYYGIGADFSFTENFSARVNYTRAKLGGSNGNDGRDIDYLSAAVSYRF